MTSRLLSAVLPPSILSSIFVVLEGKDGERMHQDLEKEVGHPMPQSVVLYYDVVPLQPTNIWDNGLAALPRLARYM